MCSYGDVTTIKNVEIDFKDGFKLKARTAKPLVINSIVMGLLSILLYKLGQCSAPNSYTDVHRDFNVFVYWSVSRILCIVVCMKKLREYKLIKNKTCVAILTPFVILIRLAVLLWFCHWIVYELYPHEIIAFQMNSINWWKSPTEPWLTNCSASNAFFSWLIWPVFMLYSILGIVFVISQLIVLLVKPR